jgi:hypothetical protein
MEEKFLNKTEEVSINPTDFIKNASALKIQKELMEKQLAEQQILQDKINRKLRKQLAEEKQHKKIKTIEDALKKGKKIRWEIVNNGHLKGFVKNRIVFEIKKGMTIYNLYIKDTSLLKEGTKAGYISCASVIQKIKDKSESLIK